MEQAVRSTLRTLRLALAGLAVLAAFQMVGPEAQARGPLPSTDTVAIESLPPEAQRVHQLILRGGPFRYAKDGTVFGNRERLLPRKPRGYYREYTVPTPRLNHRGARRIVCGGQEPAQPDACYYTSDHYASFKLIVGGRAE